MRLPLDQLNEVTFSLEGGTGSPNEDGILRSIDGQEQGQSITVSTYNLNSQEYAFAVYQAPENFVRSGYDDDKLTSERKITLKIKSNRLPLFEFTQELRLVRPPLILIHGLWSGPEMWQDFSNSLKIKFPGLRILTADYSDTNASHLDVNTKVPYDYIMEARKQLKLEKIAMTQADILGHSMGGILGRIRAGGRMWTWAGGVEYKQDNNFEMGDINKLITLDSPHFGSFLDDFAIEYIEVLGIVNPEKRDSFLEDMRENGFPVDEGAIEDLMTTSPETIYMNSIPIDPSSHAIVGDAGVNFKVSITMLGSSGKLLEAVLESGVGTDVGPSDLVVSTKSQAGGLVAPTSSIFKHHHMAATGEEVVNKTIELLNAEPDSSLFNPGFPENKWPE